MKTPTIYDIKYDTKEKSPYFFSSKTMRFFGQTLKDFRVVQSPKGNIFIYAPSYWDGHIAGYTIREYKNHDLLMVNEEIKYGQDKLDYVLNYIQSH